VNPIERYLAGAFESAALYYSISRALWPGDTAPAAGIPHAVLWGLIMQILVMRREGLSSEPKRLDLRSSFSFCALAGLSAFASYWAGVTFDRTTAQLISGIGFGAYVLAVGVVVVRRRRGHAVGSGT
jgi:hypothetical protein